MIEVLIRILSVVLTGLSFGCLAYVLIQAFRSGADAYSGAYSESTARQFEDIFMFIPPRRITEIGWAAAISASLALYFISGGFAGSPVAVLTRLILCTLIGGIPMMMFPAALLRYLKQRRRKRFNLQLVDALSNMGNALKSGFSITQAFEHIVENGDNPISQEFATFLHQTRVGVNFADALDNLEKRVGSEDLTLVVLSIDTARKTGGNLTEIFEKIAHTIRERMRIENRITTLTAQGRLQGIIVGIMPAAIAIVLYNIQPDLFKPFLHSAAGVITILVTIFLLTCGALSIRKIIRIDV